MKTAIEENRQFLEAIGLIAVRWAVVDHLLAQALGRLIDDYNAGHNVIYSIESSSARLDVVQGVIRTIKTGNALADALRKAVPALKKLLKMRNRYIHNQYGIGFNGEISLLRNTPLGKQYFYFEDVRLSDLHQHAARISEIGAEISMILYPNRVS